MMRPMVIGLSALSEGVLVRPIKMTPPKRPKPKPILNEDRLIAALPFVAVLTPKSAAAAAKLVHANSGRKASMFSTPRSSRR